MSIRDEIEDIEKSSIVKRELEETAADAENLLEEVTYEWTDLEYEEAVVEAKKFLREANWENSHNSPEEALDNYFRTYNKRPAPPTTTSPYTPTSPF